MVGITNIAFYSLIGAIREKYPDIPIHVHSHDTAGISAASMLAAAAAGADVVDVAIDSKNIRKPQIRARRADFLA